MMRIALFVFSLSLAASGLVHAQEAARPAPSTLTRPKGDAQPVDSRGFIHRWFVLEPVPVAGRLTEPAVKEALKLAALPETAQPSDGAKVTINGTEHAWHALDTLNYNLNLYHFAWSLSKPTSNVLFWVETAIDAPREMQNVRLAIGSNAASRWWLNGEPVIALNDDRQSVIDDGVSRRVTLRKGRNVIRAAIINGGGATDFCARFLDENDRPLVGLNSRL
ncbi:acetylxylan esterase [Steroidobacter agaridevorans]|nr:acetylxylan esterase [Steroidobacter agaridevorans]